MIRLLSLAVLVGVSLAVPRQAQTQTQEPKVDAQGRNVLLDTERVRVIEVRIKPGAKLELKGSPYQFLYMLSDGSLVFAPAGKMPYEFLLKAGEVSLLPSQSSAENDGEKEIRAVLVELKEGERGASKASASKGKSRAVRGRSRTRTRGRS
jgi:quercetin dioxygenase-like cupin family protein